LTAFFSGNGKAVDHVNQVGVQLFPGLTQQAEQGLEQICDPMQPTIETALAQHFRNIAIFLQVLQRLLEVPAKVQRSHNRRRHHFGIPNLALWVFLMMQCFQHIVTKTKDCYNLSVHAIL
jgi:hypothetical protein